jgi:zinc protease
MKRNIKIIIFFLLFFIPGAISSLNAAFFPYLMYEKQLQNNMRIVVIPMKDVPYISFATVIMTGSRNETDPGYTGYAHLLEHMMFRGSENVSTDERVERLYKYGGDSNAYTTMDYTCYTVNCAPSGWKDVLIMEADRLQRLLLAPEDFKAETGAVIGEFGISEKYPGSRMSNTLRACMFDGHPYEHSVIGYKEDVMNMPEGYEYIRTFYDKSVRPEKTVMFIAGKIEKPGDLLSEAESLFEDWKYEPSPVFPVEYSLDAVQCIDTLSDVSIPASRVKIAWKIPGYNQDTQNHIAAKVLAEHYFHESSPLMIKLRDEKKWISGSSFSVPFTMDPFWISLDLTLTEEGKEASIREYINGILIDSRYELTVKDLENIKRRLFYRTQMRLDSPASVLGVLAEFSHVSGDPQEVNHYFIRLERLEILDIRLFHEQYLKKSNQSLVWMFAT